MVYFGGSDEQNDETEALAFFGQLVILLRGEAASRVLGVLPGVVKDGRGRLGFLVEL